MIWVVGTGRCGTGSYAKQVGGVHEPKPAIFRYVHDWIMGEGEEEWVLSTLMKHMVYGKPLVHNRYSLVIPQIKKVDPKAEFVWLIRKPKECIESMASYGFFGERKDGVVDDTRPVPKNDMFSSWSLIKKNAWYYRWLNALIKKDLNGDAYKVIKTEDIGVRENVGEREEFNWTEDEVYLLRQCEDLYKEIVK